VLDSLRQLMTRLLTPLARALLTMGVTPNHVTVAGTIVVVAISLWAFPTGHLAVGAAVVALTALADSLDGVMARQSGASSRWGAFLDSTLDRFADAAVLSGLVLWFSAGGDDRLTMVLALLVLVLGSVIPYTRAKAEGIGVDAKVGVAERADRLAVVLLATFAVGVGAPPLVLTIVLGLLVLASAVTVGQRMAAVRRQTQDA
jgi:CDP-diacylglycerol---glycerol-3-phosphate 3-phosphatidyltransferase